MKKIIITESQYRRLLKEQDYQYDTSSPPKTTTTSTHLKNDTKKGRPNGKPIKNLSIIQPNNKSSFEQGLGYIMKATGIADILVTSDMGFSSVIKVLRKMSSDGRGYWGTPKVLYPNSLDTLLIGTHGGNRSAGCGRFTITDQSDYNTNGFKFLEYLSRFTKPSTKVFFTGCFTGEDPYFIGKLASALGVNEVTASTDAFYPGRFWDHIPQGHYITCPPIEELIPDVDKTLPGFDDKLNNGQSDERQGEITKRITKIGCRLHKDKPSSLPI